MSVNWKKLTRQIPNKIQVRKDVVYEVVYIDEFIKGDIWGECRFDDRQIVLKKGLSPKNTVVTFLHETLHCLSYEYELDLTETQVLKAEKALYYLLKKGNIFKELS